MLYLLIKFLDLWACEWAFRSANRNELDDLNQSDFKVGGASQCNRNQNSNWMWGELFSLHLLVQIMEILKMFLQ